jgi:hypothetical protein
MAYDVETKPAAWVARQATRRSRRVWLVASGCFAIAAVLILLGITGRATIGVTAGLIVVVLALGRVGDHVADDAVHWIRGARAERSVGEELEALRRDGFVVLHDVEALGRGNIDHIVSGPTGVYVVETKHGGYRHGHLAKARWQAAKLHDELGVWVTPVICIHTRRSRPFRHDRVWIVPQPSLLDWIRGQRNASVAFERLARFADGL